MNPHNLPFNLYGTIFFKTEKEMNRYSNNFELREVLPAHRVRLPCANDEGNRTYQSLARSRVYNFVSLDTSFVKDSYVQLFYSNLVEVDGSNGTEYETHINGTEFRIGCRLIHEYTDLPCDIQPYDGRYDEDEFLFSIGIHPRNLRNPPVHQLSPSHKLLHEVVSKVLRPRDPPHDIITSEDANFMELVLTSLPVDWCQLVLNHMNDATKHDWGLPYATLIMKILNKSDLFPYYGGNISINYAMPIGNLAKPRWENEYWVPLSLQRSDSEDSDDDHDSDEDSNSV